MSDRKRQIRRFVPSGRGNKQFFTGGVLQAGLPSSALLVQNVLNQRGERRHLDGPLNNLFDIESVPGFSVQGILRANLDQIRRSCRSTQGLLSRRAHSHKIYQSPEYQIPTRQEFLAYVHQLKAPRSG